MDVQDEQDEGRTGAVPVGNRRYGSLGKLRHAEAAQQPTHGANPDNGADSANGDWLRRLVRPLGFE